MEGIRLLGILLPCALLLPGVTRAQETELDCLIEARETIVVSAPFEARVASVLVERGDLVSEGQVLATLESSLEQANVVAARARAELVGPLKRTEARVDYVSRDHERTSRLFERGVAADGKRDEAESMHKIAEAEHLEAQENKRIAQLELRRAEAALELRTIRSPLEGVVVERILNPGEYADPPQIVKIARVDPLHVEVFAPVALLGRIQLGMRGQVIPEEPVGGVHEASVVVVDRVVDAASATFGVRLELPNPELAIPAGLKCRVRF